VRVEVSTRVRVEGDDTYVAVEPHAVLEKRVWGVLDTRDHGARRESRLLDVTVVVLRVLVQDQATDLVHGEITTRPDLGDIEGIEAKLQWVSLFRLHDLHLSCPFDLLSVLNGLPQLLLGVVGVLAGNADGLGLGELLLAVLCKEVVLDVDEVAGLRVVVSTICLLNRPTTSEYRYNNVTSDH
jgi:hypothetical protein